MTFNAAALVLVVGLIILISTTREFIRQQLERSNRLEEAWDRYLMEAQASLELRPSSVTLIELVADLTSLIRLPNGARVVAGVVLNYQFSNNKAPITRKLPITRTSEKLSQAEDEAFARLVFGAFRVLANLQPMWGLIITRWLAKVERKVEEARSGKTPQPVQSEVRQIGYALHGRQLSEAA